MKKSTFETILTVINYSKENGVRPLELDDIQIILERNYRNLKISKNTLQAIQLGYFDESILTDNDFKTFKPGKDKTSKALDRLLVLQSAIITNNFKTVKEISAYLGFTVKETRETLDICPHIKKGNFFYGISSKDIENFENSDFTLINNTTGEILEIEEIVKIIKSYSKKGKFAKKFSQVNNITGDIIDIDLRLINFLPKF